MPPVAKTRIPAACAAIIVADTVVAAQPPRAIAALRLGRAAFITEPRSAVARACSAAVVEADEQASVVDRDRGGHGAGLAHRRLRRASRPRGCPGSQAVADQRGLERDDGAARGEGGRDLRVDRQAVHDAAVAGGTHPGGSSVRGLRR